MKFFINALSAAMLPLQRAILRRRVGRLVLEYLDGVPLLVLPDVFNPAIFRSSALLARTIATFAPPGQSAGQESGAALDMGTGSGVGAIFAARQGYRVVGVDINPEAVRCARINALLNHLEDRVEVREGDLFAPVQGERFDLVLFNPPFFRGEPKSHLDAAWRSADVLERFAAGLPAALKPDGHALIVLSTHGDALTLLERLHAYNVGTLPIVRREYSTETLTVYAASLRK
ncbi:MAG TPA: methyltransferase [Chthonomonadaceae bacterium]|nr:methyltransferase [Chthonomonadaceae bacterium]